MPLWSQVSDATYLQVNFGGKLCFLWRSRRIKLTAAETSKREREKQRKESCQVKFSCYFHPRILKEFLLSCFGFCAAKERIKFLCHKQGALKTHYGCHVATLFLKSILSNFFCRTKSAEQIYSNTCHMCMRNDSGFSGFEFISLARQRLETSTRERNQSTPLGWEVRHSPALNCSLSWSRCIQEATDSLKRFSTSQARACENSLDNNRIRSVSAT